MKRKLYLLCVFFVFSLVFVSCEDEAIDVDESLLIGTWRSGTLHEKYNANGTGSTWDTSDDVSEDEAQPFTWTVSGAELRQLHIMEMGPSIPKTYTIRELTTTTLRYEDFFGKSTSFTRVN